MKSELRRIQIVLFGTFLFSYLFYISSTAAQPSDGPLESGTQLIVMIEGQATLGAGIIFGWDKGRLYIATANHVVRNGPQEAQDLRIRLKTSPEKPLKATLLKHADRELDLAVLSVEGRENQGVNPCSLQIDRLVQSAAKRGDAVYPVGNPNGVPWGMPVTPDRVAQVVGDQVTFQSTFISKGHSGGGLLTEAGDVVGVIRADQPPFGSATNIEKVLQTLQAWGYPIELRVRNAPPPLVRAIEKRDTNEVKRLLGAKCVKVNERHSGLTPLLIAADKGSGPIVDLLLKAGAQTDAKTQEKKLTPLHLAAKNGHADVVKILIAAQADIEATSEDWLSTPLEYAVWEGHREVAKLLVQAGAKTDFVRLRFQGSQTLLHIAAGEGRVETTKLLIELGADIEATLDDILSADTPLFYAIYARYDGGTPLTVVMDVVKVLLAAGADINRKNLKGQTVLSKSLDREDKELIKFLISAGAEFDPEQFYKLIYDAHDTEIANWYGTARAFLAKANLDQIFPLGGNTPLTLSVSLGEVEMSKLLLEAGANVNATDGEGWTALRYAAVLPSLRYEHRRRQQRALLQLLLQAGADVNAKDRKGDPILCSVIEGSPTLGRYETVEILLKAGSVRILLGECSGRLDRDPSKEKDELNALIKSYPDM